MSRQSQPTHADFPALAESWLLYLQSEQYAPRTCEAYLKALDTFAAWLYGEDPTIGPAEVTRDHVRGWIVAMRETGRSPGSVRSWFAGIRHFFRWCATEEEIERDPTEGIRTPPPGEQVTEVLSTEDIRKLLGTCTGKGFVARRDAALILLFADGGVRLAEAAGLRVDDVNIRDRIVFVSGKGTNRSGPRHRAVPLGVKAAQALDRYLRERRRHPFADSDALWLGGRNRGAVSQSAIVAVLKRRGAAAGIRLHPHMFRHSWASEFRAAGGSEGDLMVLGGWRSRTMLDRYGRKVAADRARDSYRRHSLGDRL